MTAQGQTRPIDTLATREAQSRRPHQSRGPVLALRDLDLQPHGVSSRFHISDDGLGVNRIGRI
jgi:hypothetical protein